MKTVYKYALQTSGITKLHLPENAQPLHADIQHGVLQLWALVDTDQPLVPRSFIIAGTGEAMLPGLHIKQYVNTFLMYGGEYVFHVFEVELL